MGRVVALMDDLFFQMKVAETAKHLGVELKVATNGDALVCLHGVRQAGLLCPGDLAVMGVDATALGAVSAPPLTSVGFDAATIVDVSVAAMMTELGYPSVREPSGENVARLIQRAST